MQPFWVKSVGTHSRCKSCVGKPVCLVAFLRPPLVACTVVLLLGSFATLLACQVLGQLELLEP